MQSMGGVSTIGTVSNWSLQAESSYIQVVTWINVWLSLDKKEKKCQILIYNGPSILKPLLQPKKDCPKFKMMLKQRDIPIENITVVLLMAQALKCREFLNAEVLKCRNHCTFTLTSYFNIQMYTYYKTTFINRNRDYRHWARFFFFFFLRG